MTDLIIVLEKANMMLTSLGANNTVFLSDAKKEVYAMQKREEVMTRTIKEFVDLMEEILQEDMRECRMIDSEANGYFLHRTESIVKSPQYQALKSIKEYYRAVTFSLIMYCLC